MTNTEVLVGKVAVVTGAARGIGEAISHTLAGMGAHVLLLARDQTALQNVRQAIEAAGGKASVHAEDLRDPAAVERFAAAAASEHKRCDVLVNNAGSGRFGGPLHEMPIEAWDETLETNLRAPYLLIRAFAPLMIAQKSGHIINISSLAGHNPVANGAAYSASKWGLNGLTYSVA